MPEDGRPLSDALTVTRTIAVILDFAFFIIVPPMYFSWQKPLIVVEAGTSRHSISYDTISKTAPASCQ
ncbi:MAG: hypothetical protein FWE21_04745 [Defluviitaleaceae bacterium]|nr:hypothetical protein [Defluviitaleaceae bacterium]